MILKNLSKKTIVTGDLKEAKSLGDKMLGLLKRSNPRSMMFETRFGIHTFFMREAIDVLILDSKHKVCQMRKGLVPGRIFIYSPKYLFVVELPEGAISKSKTTIGDELKLTLS